MLSDRQWQLWIFLPLYKLVAPISHMPTTQHEPPTARVRPGPQQRRGRRGRIWPVSVVARLVAVGRTVDRLRCYLLTYVDRPIISYTVTNALNFLIIVI